MTNLDSPKVLVWNHSQGQRSSLHPGLNVIDATQWQAARSGFELWTLDNNKDVEELGADLQAIDARKLVRAVRGMVNPSLTVGSQARPIAAALDWLEQHETRPRVKRAIRTMRDAGQLSRARASAAEATRQIRDFIAE